MDKVQDVLEDARRDLKLGRPEARRAAVKKLAALGTRESFELVLEALADPDGQAGDEAQLAIGRVKDARLFALVQGPLGLASRDEWVKLRAFEACGRIEDGFDVRKMFGGVLSRDPELARTALWSIERQARAKGLAADERDTGLRLDGFVRGSLPPEVRGAALLALLSVDAFAAHDRALEALSDSADALRCAGMLVVGTFSEQEAFTLSTRALADTSDRVRTVAIANLERLKSRAAVLALIEQLGRESRSRLKCEIRRYLRETSGLEYGDDLAAWRAWANTLKGPWSTGEARASSPYRGDTHVKLAGFELTSDRVTFLIDMSGSMWNTDAGGRTRKELVDMKLRACLEALPASSAFNVIPYTKTANAFEKRLVRATKENVGRAATWFEKRNERGSGNVFDAALLALEDPDVDTLVVLTDGVPTGGRRWNMDLMVELLVERNRFRQVAFDSLLVEAPKGNRRAWTELAARTGGRSLAIEAQELIEKEAAR
ncbi:MAG: hypothetical protein SGI72_17070 [Planctomycetota bacterium]|nr:hypothetical protein [Planctomycetota bacterium]